MANPEWYKRTMAIEVVKLANAKAISGVEPEQYLSDFKCINPDKAVTLGDHSGL